MELRQIRRLMSQTGGLVGRLIAIGDVHGRFNKLEGLLSKISPQPDDRIVFLGEYIDRGSESYEVVELLIRLKVFHLFLSSVKG